MPFCPFLGEGSPAKIDYRKKGTLILASLLEDPDIKGNQEEHVTFWRSPSKRHLNGHKCEDWQREMGDNIYMD